MSLDYSPHLFSSNICKFIVILNIYTSTSIILSNVETGQWVGRKALSFQDMCRDRLAGQQVATIISRHM